MNAVIDEDLPRSFAKTFSQTGFTPLDIRDHNLRGASDERIYSFAQKKNAILFSADLGFSNILRFPPGTHHGICILRYPNEMPTSEVNQSVKALLEKLTQNDYTGSLIILSPGKLRLRRSPQ
jgi:predicted nuclease of predicted toxin-antitoxin system